MDLLIENDYKKIKYLSNIKLPYLNISFKIGEETFKYPFRPDTGFIPFRVSEGYNLKSCEMLKEKIEKRGISGRPKNLQVSDGSIIPAVIFNGRITEISDASGNIKLPQDLKAILYCTGCKNRKLREESNLKCLGCYKDGTPNIFGFDLMDLWIAKFNGVDKKFSIKTE